MFVKNGHQVCNEKIASSNPKHTTVCNILVRLLKTTNRRNDKILFKHKVQIWLKSAVWYATALDQLEGMKSLPATGIILAFIEAQIWSTGIVHIHE